MADIQGRLRHKRGQANSEASIAIRIASEVCFAPILVSMLAR